MRNQSFKHSMLIICSELPPRGTVEWWGGVETAVQWLAVVPLGMEESHRLALQDKLVDVIMRVLVRHPELHYYQVKGYRLFGVFCCCCWSIWTVFFCGLYSVPSSPSLPHSLFQYLDICCCLWQQFNNKLQEFWCLPSHVTSSWFG